MKSLKESFIKAKDLNKISPRISFKKKDLELGTIVMFGDGTFGVYIEGTLSKTIKEDFDFYDAEDKFFIGYVSGVPNSIVCYTNLDTLNDSLIDKYDDDFSVIRIYGKKLGEQEILEFTRSNFYTSINKIVSSLKEYKDRKL